MPKTDFHDYVVYDLMSHIEGITGRSMFGGYGLYKDGVVFGIIADDELYFKTDEKNLSDYKKAGSKPFCYENGKKKIVTMSYWEVPADVLEDREALEKWAEESCRASLRSKKIERRPTGKH